MLHFHGSVGHINMLHGYDAANPFTDSLRNAKFSSYYYGRHYRIPVKQYHETISIIIIIEQL